MTDVIFEKEAKKMQTETVMAVNDAYNEGWPPSQLNVTLDTILEEYIERVNYESQDLY